MIDIGSARLGINVADTFLRNRKITSTTNTSVNSSVNLTSSTDASIDWERSYSVTTCTVLGISLWIRARAALTPSATLTVFVPGWRWTASTMAGSALTQLAVLLFWTSFETRPISDRRTGAPLRYATIMVAKALALDNCPLASTVRAVLGPHRMPVGRLT